MYNAIKKSSDSIIKYEKKQINSSFINRATFADETVVDFKIRDGSWEKKKCTDGICGRVLFRGQKELFTLNIIPVNWNKYELKYGRIVFDVEALDIQKFENLILESSPKTY